MRTGSSEFTFAGPGASCRQAEQPRRFPRIAPLSVGVPAALFVALATSASFAVQAWVSEGEILHDLVEEYRSAEISDSYKTSVGDVSGSAEMNCSLLKRYLLLHPPSGAAAAATASYSMQLPRIERDQKLLFLFAIGLKPGWREEDRAGADGVVFRVLLDGKKDFEQLWDRDEWCFCVLDLSPRAGRTIRLTLVCDKNRNSSADWALWGDPRVVFLSPAYWAGRTSPRANFFLFETPSSEEIAASYPALGPAGTGVIRPAASSPGISLAWFPTPIQQQGAPRLPLMKVGDGSSPTLRRVAAAFYKPKIEVVSVAQSPAVVTPNESFRVLAIVKNVGEGQLHSSRAPEIRLGVPPAFRLADGEAAIKTPGEMRPGEESSASWRLFAPPQPGGYQFVLRVGVSALKVFDVIVSPAGKGIDYGYIGPDASGFHQRDDSILLQKGNNRLAFVRDNRRFSYATLLLKRKDGWKPFGRLAPFGELSLKLRNGTVQKIEIRPANHLRLTNFGARPVAEDELAIAFSDEFTDGDSVKWRFSQSFAVRGDSPWIEVQTALTPESDRELVLFLAPKLLAGDGSFGASKEQAIFPGLEYLGKDEPSSGTRDMAFPLSRRFTPHPLRVTVPLMAVRKGDAVVGISWDPYQKWHDGKEMPTPLFSSPNRFPAQDNHLMGLIVPSVPDFTEEGTLDSKRSLSVAANQTISTTASILLLLDVADITDAVVAWIERHGLPEITEPRSFEDEVQLCRHGFLHSVWDESAQGWSHCIGWPPGPYPGYCTLLMMDYFLSRDDAVRQSLRKRIDLVVGKCIKRSGGNNLWRGDACHILTGELPFLEGRVVECIAAWEQDADTFLSGQSPDGSWRWHPDERHASLGKPGDTTSGMCARGACRVLREAVVTGNRKHIEAALKALRFLDRYTIPTGAQEWECPIYAPDVLAAAYAVRAFVLAYEITGDENYLEKAKFWAKTGIAFIYLWDRGDDIPQMRYAGIPIFGATFHTHSWLGRPVQWCALVYAYSLLRLSQYDQSLDWRRLARGVTVSAMWQQYTEGNNKGCYPDSWDLVENHPNPAEINPEDILVNLFALNAYDPGLKHRVLNRSGNPIFVTSIAEIPSADLDANGTISVRLKFFPGAKTYLLVAGYPHASKPEIFLNGNRIASTENVDAVPAGWSYFPRRRWLVIGLTHAEKGDVLEIRPPSS